MVVEAAADHAGLETGHADRVAAVERELLDVLASTVLRRVTSVCSPEASGGHGHDFGERAGLHREADVMLADASSCTLARLAFLKP